MLTLPYFHLNCPTNHELTPISIATPIITGTTATTKNLAPDISSTTMCPKCGTLKKSGRLSCCAPGGAWFTKCGRTRTANIEHTWIEGTHACQSKSTNH